MLTLRTEPQNLAVGYLFLFGPLVKCDIISPTWIKDEDSSIMPLRIYIADTTDGTFRGSQGKLFSIFAEESEPNWA